MLSRQKSSVPWQTSKPGSKPWKWALLREVKQPLQPPVLELHQLELCPPPPKVHEPEARNNFLSNGSIIFSLQPLSFLRRRLRWQTLSITSQGRHTCAEPPIGLEGHMPAVFSLGLLMNSGKCLVPGLWELTPGKIYLNWFRGEGQSQIMPFTFVPELHHVTGM